MDRQREYPEDRYDVFLSYNSQDRDAALELYEELKARDVRPWIDVHDSVPGKRWQDQLEQVIGTSPAVAVLVGASGLGPWEDMEAQGALEEFVERKAAVIPVLLKDAPPEEDPKKLLKSKLFLRGFVAVDLRKEGLDRLVLGIEAARRRGQSAGPTEDGSNVLVAATSTEDAAPKPTFRRQETEPLAARLEDLYDRREQLTVANEDTRALDGEILDVRRLLRKGPQLQAGEQLLDGRYRLVEPLGKGGFATVWKAYDRKLRRLVAAKVLHGQHADERTRRERFFRGSRKMAELVHPHVVRVLEEELDDDGWLFFVMELVPGGDFGRAILEGKLPVGERLRIVRQVGEVLEFAHRRGVVHRDVKPSNVLLDDDLQPKLTDFDLVRDEDSTGFTQTRAMLGTLNYAAPEALEAPKDAGPPADVYSLASTAVFALRGGPLPRRYYRDPGQAIAELDLSPAFARVLTRATAEDPEERYPSAAAFVEALEKATATPEPKAKSGKKKSGKKKTPAAGFKELFLREGLWCEIPPGVGWVGSPESEEGRRSNEGPRHQVEIARPFWLASVPVTNDQYAAYDSDKPFQTSGGAPGERLGSHPRVGVSWHDAMSFCRWLSENGLEGARLPTEEEWEYACRAGTETAYWSGDDERSLADVGWYDANSGNRIHRVGRKAVNPWGLYDMHGNVWEWTASVWVEDKYLNRPRDQPFRIDPAEEPADLAAGSPGGDRVMRGGGYWGTADWTRAAFRSFGVPGFMVGNRGFRVLLPFAPSV